MGSVTTLGRRLAEDRRLLRLALIAILIRLLIMAVSAGSNDIIHWWRLAGLVRDSGLGGAYEATAYANHPPLAMLYMGAARTASDTMGIPFAWLAKLPALVGDITIGTVLWHMVTRRQGSVAGRRVSLAYLFAPTPILLSAYHGNTDMLYVACVFGAAVAIVSARPVLAGLLFGAALNVKLLPVVLSVAFVTVLLRRGGAVRFVWATILAMTPLWILLAWSPHLVWERIFAYQPAFPDAWGIVGIEAAARLLSGSVLTADSLWYFDNGRLVLGAAILLAAVVAHRARLDVFAAVALAAVTFLVATPGFGVQYLAIAVPLLFAVDVRLGATYSWVAGAFLTAAYGSALVRVFPAFSIFAGQRPILVIGCGLATWAVALWCCRRLATLDQQSHRGGRADTDEWTPAGAGAGTPIALTAVTVTESSPTRERPR